MLKYDNQTPTPTTAGLTSTKANCLTFGSKRYQGHLAARNYHLLRNLQTPVNNPPASTLPPMSRLAAAKEGLFNPHLPRLRRMDMDSVGCNLAEEHSRSSTRCTSETFQWFNSPNRYLWKNRPLIKARKTESDDSYGGDSTLIDDNSIFSSTSPEAQGCSMQWTHRLQKIRSMQCLHF